MTIPTRDELIERAREAGEAYHDDSMTPDFALAEGRRWVAEELEALREDLAVESDDNSEWANATRDARAQIGARLAAMREQTEHDSRVTAEETTRGSHAKAEQPSADLRQSAGSGSATYEGDTMNFGGHDKPGAESQAPRLQASERAEGRAASSPCPPSALLSRRRRRRKASR